jgi:hypothetical protein
MVADDFSRISALTLLDNNECRSGPWPFRATVHGSQLELIFDRKSNYMSPCLLVENVAVLVVQKEVGR